MGKIARRVTRARRRKLLSRVMNMSYNVLSRQLGKRSPRGLAEQAQARQLRALSQALRVDSHDPHTSELKLPFLRRRSRVAELACCGDAVLVLTESGVCQCFERVSGRRACYLNTQADEVVRSLFVNRGRGVVVTVSVHRADNFSALRCRATPVASLLAGRPDAGEPVFAGEDLSWPGYIEYDDCNELFVTNSASTGTFKVWSPDTFAPSFEVSSSGVDELKLGAGIVVLMGTVQDSRLPVTVVDAASGDTVAQWTHPLPNPFAELAFAEVLAAEIALQQVGGPLEIVQLATGAAQTIDGFDMPAAFLYLSLWERFIAFRHGRAELYNTAGQQLLAFAEHDVPSPSTVCLSRDQTLVASSSAVGATVNVSDTRSGRLVAEVAVDPAAAVTALCYDEEHGAVVTGDTEGVVRVFC